MQRRFQQAFSSYIFLCMYLVGINSAAYLQQKFMKKRNGTLQSHDAEYKMASVSTCGLQCLSANDNRCLFYEFYSTTNTCRVSHLPTISADVDVSDSVVYEVVMGEATTEAYSTQYVTSETTTTTTATTTPTTTAPPPITIPSTASTTTPTTSTTTTPARTTPITTTTAITTTTPTTATTTSEEISEVEVYTQESTTSTYLYQEHLPAMSEFTACFWFDFDISNDLSKDYLFTISTSADAEEAVLGIGGSGNLGLKVQGSATMALSLYTSQLPSMMQGWHKHCFTWKASGDFTWYRSSDMDGSLELMDTSNAKSYTIRNDGYFILLQYQTTHGGGLSSDKLMLGKMANFNMWDKEMSLQQINTLTCAAKGNVTSWDTLQRQGNVDMGTLETPFCNSD